ncbi:DUF998 domain-containing protein [Kribbella sp. VKM Ac-2568]|uniref:DUF998 domain-containing protein n=1 Tax=Kribbella sp. VKM Ac-2568 TaxID=2512219 RepID=UPI001049BE48|nr:DUF998 domain-containing protein [Kribbella sp. VKM Ac-2568]TCM47799.1 putative membrane protein [Kribbella sp. VKM Ac-2568]
MSAVQDAHTRNQESAGGRLHERSDWSLSLPAWAGIIGPVLFTATFLAQEAFRRSEYDALAEPVSALEAGPNGWIQQVNFVVFGVLTIVFALGLHRGLRPSRAGVAGPALLFLSGVGSLLAAIFPLRQDAAGVTYDPGGHIVAGFMFFLTSAVGLIVVSRRVAHDPRWQSLATYSLAAGIVAFVGFLVGGGLVMPDDAPLHDWAGLYQRVLVVAVLFPCRILLSIRLLRVATGRR